MTWPARPIRLLPAERLVQTNPLDQAAWTTSGVLGAIERQRFCMAVDLLPPGRVGDLLEIGYGSGIFQPELAHHAERLAGADVHPMAGEVMAILREEGVESDLRQASVTELPWSDDAFDVAVVVSALEFVDDIDGAADELARVLRPTGTLVVVTPGHSVVLDAGHYLLTRTHAEDTFQGRRTKVVPALERRFVVDRQLSFPPAVPGVVRMFRALRFTVGGGTPPRR